jgi:hypothetical protein
VALGLTHRPGQSLQQPLAKKIEAALGADFSAVRVHIGPEPGRVGALAFAMGTDMYFAPGQYQPDSPQGQRLLVHELTHVLQQREGRVRGPAGAGIAVVHDSLLEAEADRNAQRVTAAIQRQQAAPGPRDSGATQQGFLGASAHRRMQAGLPRRHALIQRYLQIDNIDFDPLRNSFISSRIRQDSFGNKAQFDTLFADICSDAEAGLLWNWLGSLTLIKHAADVPALAAEVINEFVASASGNDKKKRQIHWGPDRNRERLIHQLAISTATNASEKERNVFTQLLKEADPKSRAKGTPSVVAVGKLLDAQQASIKNLQDRLIERNNEIDLLATYVNSTATDPHHRANSGFGNLRSTHEGRAGWLAASPQSVQQSFQATFTQWLAGMIQAPNSQEAITLQGFAASKNKVLAQLTLDELEATNAPRAVKRVVYGSLFFRNVGSVGLTTKGERVQLAWARYVDSAVNNQGSTYLEFDGVNGQGISRIVWNFITDQFFICVHYNWFKGYNPFFAVTGLPRTY